MKCGFYELDITPPLGSIIPGGFGARYADEILDPLYARAMVMQTEGENIAVVVVDACGITMDITERIRRRVMERVPLKEQEIMVIATHSHGAGPTLNWGEEVVTDAAYLQNLIQKAADAIVNAWKRAKESELFVGKEELSDMSYIRVYKMKDGSLLTNPDPNTLTDQIQEPSSTIDPSVLVLAIKQEGKYVGAMVNYANHPAIVYSNMVTGDYISILSAERKRHFGPEFVTIFVNGACGNINHLNPYDLTTYKWEQYRKVGKSLAEKVKAAMENVTPVDGQVHAACKDIFVRFRKPTPEMLLNAQKVFADLGDELIESRPGQANYTDTFFALQTFWVQADKRTQRKVALQVFKIGPCSLIGTPCQMFVEFGKKIKAACGEYCFVAAFANDYCGYVPTEECMREGVYEARLAFTSGLEPAAGNLVSDAAIELYKQCGNNS